LHTALLRVVDSSVAPWDPAGSKSLTIHVADIMSNVAANERRSWKAKHEVVSHALAHDDRAVDGAPIPEDALVEIEGAAHWARVRDELLPVLDREDAEGGAVLRAILKGVEGHAQIAAHAGVETERVRLAYDRIKNRARGLLRREMQNEIERMKRGRATGTQGTTKDQLS
jgi:hypothetical protein